MARIDLYIDRDKQRCCYGQFNVDAKDIPNFVQGNTPTLRVQLLQNWTRQGFSLIATDGLTIQLALLDSALNILSAQYSWTAYDGLYWEAQLQMNTTEVSTYLSTSLVKQGYLQVDYLEGGLPSTVLLAPVTIKKTGISLNALVPTATPTPLSAEAAAATFLKLHDDRPHYLVGADGSEIKLWNDSGTFKADNIA